MAGVWEPRALGCPPACLPSQVVLTRAAWPAALAEGPITMLTLLDDWVSLVLPPSAAESPDMTSALEKLLFPKRKLRVELVDEPRLDRMSASARSRTLRWPVVVTGGGGGAERGPRWLQVQTPGGTFLAVAPGSASARRLGRDGPRLPAVGSRPLLAGPRLGAPGRTRGACGRSRGGGARG